MLVNVLPASVATDSWLCDDLGLSLSRSQKLGRLPLSVMRVSLGFTRGAYASNPMMFQLLFHD